MGSRLKCDLSTFSDRLLPSHVAQSARLRSLELALEEEDAPGSEIGPKGMATLGVETSRTEMLLKKQLTQDRHQQIQDDESRNECKQVRIAEAPKPCQKVQAVTV